MNSIPRKTARKTVLSKDQQTTSDVQFGMRARNKLFADFYERPRPDASMKRVYLDNMQLEFYVVTEITPGKFSKIRPWLTLVHDDHAGTMLGFSLSLKAPKTEEILATLLQTILPKAYPTEKDDSSFRLVPRGMGIPDEIVIDHGLDFQKSAFYTTCLKLGICIKTQTPMVPWKKGVIERLNTRLSERLPRHTFESTDDTNLSTYSQRNFATVTFNELLKALHITLKRNSEPQLKRIETQD